MRLFLMLMFVAVLTVGCTSSPKVLRVRVMSYNIHHGRGMDNKFDYQRIADLVKKYKPDVVAFQEVDKKTGRSSGVDQVLEIGNLAQMHSRFGKAMDFNGGGYGEGILTKLNILAEKNNILNCTPGNEPRSLVSVKVASANSEFTFLGTHLSHETDDDRTWQAKQINALVKDNKGLMIMVGDFNTTPAKEAYHVLVEKWDDMMLKAGVDGPTFPSVKPKVRIDYIFASPKGKWRVIEAKIIEDHIASDHRGIFAILECDVE